MMLNFGMIALILIVVLWVILIVTANRRDKRHFELADRVSKLEKTAHDQKQQIAALESKVTQVEVEINNFG